MYMGGLWMLRSELPLSLGPSAGETSSDDLVARPMSDENVR